MKSVEEYRQDGMDLYKGLTEGLGLTGVDEDGKEAKFYFMDDRIKLTYTDGHSGLTPEMTLRYFLESLATALAYENEAPLSEYFFEEVDVMIGSIKLASEYRANHPKTSIISRANDNFVELYEVMSMAANTSESVGVPQ